MPHALLLSPDDQAVSAITGVLEEMSVTCERPLDGVSAAQKLNARSFDFVLVDCENLPAAKLIFDVCRRGKHGINPVPIAIVDGRAGLPTAFRLGAELILTKPVAKDQARSTVRTAISRLKKEEPARSVQSAESAETTVSAQPEERAQAAAAAAVSSQPAIKAEPPSPPVVEAPVAPVMSTVAEPLPAPTSPVPPPSTKAMVAEDLFEIPKPSAPVPDEKLSDDPVLADLQKGDIEPAPQLLSTYEPAPQKSRGPLLAVLVLALAGGGFYAAWMYQPGFRALVQPQIDRVLALVGLAQKAVPAPAAPVPTPAQTLAKPAAGTPVAPPPAPPADAAKPDASSPNTTPGAPATAPEDTTPDSTPPPATPKPESSADSKTPSATTAASDSELESDKGIVILSSKGAEKRLVFHVQPALPKAAATERLAGTVVLKTMVDEVGNVESVHLVEGNPALAGAAMQAVKQWRYRPYVRDGRNLPFQTVVLVDFQHP
jgi:protein TonB